MTCRTCRTDARHSDRTGCCSSCGRLFKGLGAFDRHWTTPEPGERACVDPLGLETGDGEPYAILTRAALTAALATTTREYSDVASIHHLHDGHHCLCGFDSNGRARSATEHILDAYRTHLIGDPS